MGTGDPQDDDYTRVTDPGRFAVLHEAAERLLDELTEQYTVERRESKEPLGGTGDFVRTVRLIPRMPAAAPLAVAFTDFTWSRWGQINKNDFSAWDTGPILVTYDSGYGASSDEMLQVKSICLEVAARAMGGNPEVFGMEVQELRGPTPAIFLTEGEKQDLDAFTGVAVA